MAAHDVGDGVGLRHGGIREEFRLRCVARPLDADARRDVVFDGVRIADGLKVKDRLVDGARKGQVAFVDHEVLTVGFEGAVYQFDGAAQAQILIALRNGHIALQFAF